MKTFKALIILSMFLVFQPLHARDYACWANLVLGGFDNVIEGTAGVNNPQFNHRTLAVVGNTEQVHTGHVGMGTDLESAEKAALEACDLSHLKISKKGKVISHPLCQLTDCVGEH